VLARVTGEGERGSVVGEGGRRQGDAQGVLTAPAAYEFLMDCAEA
jgi:hypothetical protein